ncbi:hypothetical protein B0H17DRAFT_1146466 [Mycena rosella]|uniref:Uncharacterized protein n=1 Tax=Mycena rosella TaxID=1033263 RepID=A0AAD7CNY6_MYCRO|nr:hypothetical protein B0H17DRAFT_1146466 [Mycena rosella]
MSYTPWLYISLANEPFTATYIASTRDTLTIPLIKSILITSNVSWISGCALALGEWNSGCFDFVPYLGEPQGNWQKINYIWHLQQQLPAMLLLAATFLAIGGVDNGGFLEGVGKLARRWGAVKGYTVEETLGNWHGLPLYLMVDFPADHHRKKLRICYLRICYLLSDLVKPEVKRTS